MSMPKLKKNRPVYKKLTDKARPGYEETICLCDVVGCKELTTTSHGFQSDLINTCDGHAEAVRAGMLKMLGLV